MAINEQRRENLLLQATAYTRRAMWRVPLAEGWCEQEKSGVDELLREWIRPFQQAAHWELFVGMRQDDGWSIYFDEQPVLQFNNQGHLRRLYASSQRYSAEQGRLKLLSRPAHGGHVQFRSVELDTGLQERLVAACEWFLRAAAGALQSPTSQRVGIFPNDDESWLPLFQNRLRQAAIGIAVADVSHV